VTERVVVVGGDAAGGTVASQLLRRGDGGYEVVLLERGHHTSYSACGIPYWVAGDVDHGERLVARTPEEHRRRGVDLRIETEAVGLDVDRRRVTARERDGSTHELGFDHLVLATGATPVRPDLPGIDAPGVFGVQTLDDGEALLDDLAERQPRRAVVVGGGYIGIEMAEAMVRRGLDVVLVDQASEPMTTLDPDMGRLVREAMVGLGIDVRMSTEVRGFPVGSDGRVRAVSTDGGDAEADVVVLGLGVRPLVDLARAAGLPLGDSGAIDVDERMAVRGHDGVWAGGDCVQTFNRVSRRWGHVPLGTHANKHGRVIGANITGGSAAFPGIVGTAVSKVCDLEIARTGLREQEARDAGFDVRTATIESTAQAGYLPDASPVTVKMVGDAASRRLLGAQIVGRSGSAKRVDVCATALWNEMVVDEIPFVDLGYAPPFSPVWDPVLVCADALRSALG
jgi:NADPH-dependent 2,4-dienoyl-CoA reductase/sulfur reductase-like enzyme